MLLRWTYLGREAVGIDVAGIGTGIFMKNGLVFFVLATFDKLCTSGGVERLVDHGTFSSTEVVLIPSIHH